ncbi:MAG: membrane protein insertion efficiency factor YidD [Desulfobulbaceae bacterium]|jgi:putative membrane protein insertion efficiency factor|nr:membrane protein insertion efficiency factor YidD [Desulfobulbaceae bacterium]
MKHMDVRDWPRLAVLGLLRFYRAFLSPFLPRACRFEPTCSRYMIEAVTKYGVRRGLFMGARRLLRCHPFSPGGYDPVQ